MIDIPLEVEDCARKIFSEGYHYADAYPIWKWRKNGWSEDGSFMKLVDGCLKILWTLAETGGRRKENV